MNVDVDIALKAEVKTEIPGESSGRLLDAVTDVIRPWTEKRGLKADQIRLQREDVLIEIARKASERAKIEGIQIKPVPNKMLVPFLEKASLEEPNSPLVDWWVNLLVSAADPKSETRPYFTELISKIGPKEAKLLDDLWGQSDGVYRFGYGDSADIHTAAILKIRGKIRDETKRETKIQEEEWRTETYQHLADLAKQLVQWGDRSGLPLRFNFPRVDSNWAEYSGVFVSHKIEIDICRALNLLSEVQYTETFEVFGLAGNKYEVGILQFTDLGIQFMKACRPRSGEKTKSR